MSRLELLRELLARLERGGDGRLLALALSDQARGLLACREQGRALLHDLRLEPFDGVDDLRILAAQLLHVGDLRQQVVEALAAEDEVDDVGGTLLVEGDDAVAQALAGHGELVASDREAVSCSR